MTWLRDNNTKLNQPTVSNPVEAVVSVADNYKLDNFLHEFKRLLERYDACIVRSATDKGNLVVSVIHGLIIHEAEFKEEISYKDIKNKWYEKQSY